MNLGYQIFISYSNSPTALTSIPTQMSQNPMKRAHLNFTQNGSVAYFINSDLVKAGASSCLFLSPDPFSTSTFSDPPILEKRNKKCDDLHFY